MPDRCDSCVVCRCNGHLAGKAQVFSELQYQATSCSIQQYLNDPGKSFVSSVVGGELSFGNFQGGAEGSIPEVDDARLHVEKNIRRGKEMHPVLNMRTRP
jgi:hypothetical protein